MKKIIVALVSASIIFASSALFAENKKEALPLLPDKEAFLLTIFLKHDQSMNIEEILAHIGKTGFKEMFPPEGVEIVNWYVMMGIGQVIILRVPPERLRMVNLAIERGAWGAFKSEFYVTYDLQEARRAQAAASKK